MTSADLPRPSAPAPPSTTAHTARREGLRRVVHAASGVLGLIALQLPGRGGDLLFAGLVALAFSVEAARRTSPAIQRLVVGAGRTLLRPEELRGVSGPAALAFGYALAWWIFAAPIALVAVLVAALADPAAALVGRTFGGGARKSWIGSASCAATAAVVLATAGVAAPAMLVTACVAAAVERAPWSGADNILLPVSVGATLALLGYR